MGETIFSPRYYFAIDWVFPPDNGIEAFYGLLGHDPFIYSLTPFLLIVEGLEVFCPAWMLQKTVIFLIFFISGISGFKLLEGTPLSARYFAGILYAINPFTYVRFLSGQWVNLMAYAFMPLAALSFMRLLDRRNVRSFLSCVLWSTAV
ncbi:MAG: hypothetical protein QXV37_00760, partial [Candidatus Jordarchaeaceae archaeon]